MTPDEARRRGTLSVDEAAALCDVGRDAMYDAVHAGTVPRLPLPGRKIRIPAGHLLEMLGYPTRDLDTRAEGEDNATPRREHAPLGAVVPLASTGWSTGHPQHRGPSAAAPEHTGER